MVWGENRMNHSGAGRETPRVIVDSEYQRAIDDSGVETGEKPVISSAEIIDFAEDVLATSEDPNGDVPVPPEWDAKLMKEAWNAAKGSLDSRKAQQLEQILLAEKYFE